MYVRPNVCTDYANLEFLGTPRKPSEAFLIRFNEGGHFLVCGESNGLQRLGTHWGGTLQLIKLGGYCKECNKLSKDHIILLASFLLKF